jgi:replicative DNA helicase
MDNLHNDEKWLQLREDETRFVAAMWYNPASMNESKVKPQDFSDPRLGRIYQAMMDQHNSGAVLEMTEVFRHDPGIDQISLRQLLRTSVEFGNIRRYEGRIIRESQRRTLRTAGMRIKERAETGANISEDIAYAYETLESIDSGIEAEDYTAPELIENFRADMMNDDERKRGIMTQLPTFNKHSGGFQPGDFCVIGAFTNDGKSALKMNFAIEALKNGHSVGIISLEDSIEKYRNRMLSYMTGINSRIFRDRDRMALDASQAEALVGSEERFKKFRLVASHRAGMSIGDIEGKARYWVKKYGIEMLFVDYIQIISNPGFRDYRERMMDTVLRLTAVCRNLGIILVTSSQLNRSGENNPTLSNLAETSKIEHQADYVLLIEAKDVIINGLPGRMPTAIILAKGRDVPKNLKIDIEFEPDRMKFREAP